MIKATCNNCPANSYKYDPFLTEGKITNYCSAMQEILYSGMTTNVRLIQVFTFRRPVYRKANIIRLNKINLYKIWQCSRHLKSVSIKLSVAKVLPNHKNSWTRYVLSKVGMASLVWKQPTYFTSARELSAAADNWQLRPIKKLLGTIESCRSIKRTVDW